MTSTADDVPVPSLLRAAQGAYRHAIQRALAQADCPNLPRGGVLVVAALANRDLQPEAVVRQVSRGSRRDQLLDELAALGYLSSTGQRWQVTDLGRRAGSVIRSAIERVDDELANQVGQQGVTALRRALVVLCDIREAYEADE